MLKLPWFKKPSRPNRFVIVTLGRSGSYHLVRLLDSARDINCLGEIFKDHKVELRPIYRNRLGLKSDDISVRDEDPKGFVEKLAGMHRRQHFGFKALSVQIARRPALMEGVFHAPDWKKVFLFRNPLESYASSMRAAQTNHWLVPRKRSGDIPDTEANLPVEFTQESFDWHMTEYGKLAGMYQQAMAATPEQIAAIDYRDLGDAAKMQSLLDFLGSTEAAENLTSNLTKQFRKPFREGISNWQAFEAYVKRLELDQHLRDLAD